MLPDPWPTVKVGHPSSTKDPEREVPQAESTVRQRREINARAYVEADE